MTRTCPVCGTVNENEGICSACGFKMLGGTAAFAPISVPAPDIPLSQSQHQRSSSAYLHAVNGPARGACYPLGDRSLVLGRDPHSDIFLNDMTVSRTHATISFEAGRHKISDCCSFNGVWVNNENVDSRVLVPGDRIQIGAFTLVYKVD